MDGRFGKKLKREYKIADNLPTYILELDQYEGNAKALNSILSGLTKFLLVKFMQYKTAKQTSHKLKIVYEGACKVKESNLQTCKGHFEIIKIKKKKILGNIF